MKGRITTYEMVDVGSNYKTLPSAGEAIVDCNDVTWL